VNGNNITGSFFDSANTTNLHAVWDYWLIYKRVQEDFGGDDGAYLTFLLRRLNGEYSTVAARRWLTCPSAPMSNITQYSACADWWAIESSLLSCNDSYYYANNTRITTPFAINASYYDNQKEIVDIRLIQAGIRLGHVLNNVVVVPTSDEYTLISIVVAVVIVVFLLGLCLAAVYFVMKSRTPPNQSGGLLADDQDNVRESESATNTQYTRM